MKSAEDFLADTTEGLKVLFNDEVLLNFDVCVKAMEDYSKLLAVEEVDKWISPEDHKQQIMDAYIAGRKDYTLDWYPEKHAREYYEETFSPSAPK